MRGVQLLTLTALLVQHFVPASALRFLVVGGTGRVGASTAKHLHVLTTDEGRGVYLNDVHVMHLANRSWYPLAIAGSAGCAGYLLIL